MGAKSGLLTIEPCAFLFAFAAGIYMSIVPNLIQQKVCHPEFPPSVDFVCVNNSLVTEAAGIVTMRSSFKESLPALIFLLSGVWRDCTFLNKPILYVAFFGEVAGVVIEFIAFLDWSASPWITSIIDGVINGLGGSTKLFLVGATYIIADNSQKEDRSARLTLLFGSLSAGVCLSTGVSGYALSLLGYKWFFSGVIGMHLINFSLVWIFVKEVPKEKTEGNKWQAIKNLKAIFESRPNIGVIWLMIISSCIFSSILVAEGNMFLYFLEENFGFTVKEAGMYGAYRLFLVLLSSLVFSPFLKKFQWSDFTLGIIGGISMASSNVFLAFATTTLELFLGPLIGFACVFLFSIPKSVITKCVDAHETGTFISICSIGECTLPIIMLYFYDYIFAETFPGALFLTNATLIAVIVLFICIAAYIHKPIESSENKKNSGNEGKKYEAHSSEHHESQDKAANTEKILKLMTA